MLQQACHCHIALFRTDFEKALLDFVAIVLRLYFNFGRVAQKARTGLTDVVRIGGREQQGLTTCRASADDAFNIFIKAHIDHAIGFVQHQSLYGSEINGAAADVIANTTGSTNYNMSTMFQRGDLWAHGSTAAQRQNLDVVGEAGNAAQLIGYLIG
eukprot:gene26234-biopygen25063